RAPAAGNFRHVRSAVRSRAMTRGAPWSGYAQVWESRCGKVVCSVGDASAGIAPADRDLDHLPQR
ncbi:hypothetical protein, partial [Streptomyces sp. NPDC056983]|uniref:hypothetical protein n=1 Tax=Streptomyces sp. NPDC056983 TaxID=3345987 RepID=UPI0036383188